MKLFNFNFFDQFALDFSQQEKILKEFLTLQFLQHYVLN